MDKVAGSEESQQKIGGLGKTDAYRPGKIGFDDSVGEREDAQWGPMRWRNSLKQALEKEENRNPAPKYITSDGGDFPKSRPLTVPYATVAEAEAAARSVGVNAQYGNNLTIANLCSQVLAEIQERQLPMPRKIIVSARAFKDSDPTAVAATRDRDIDINPIAPFWRNPSAEARRIYSTKFWSSDSPLHVIRHEFGHVAWAKISPEKYRDYSHEKLLPRELTEAASVSRRAYANVDEFVSEVFAALLDGRKYEPEVMEIYRKYGGPKL